MGSTVATLSTSDPDASDSHTYELVAGEGDDDNAAFTMVGNELLLASALDFETQDTYSIRVRSTDEGGESVEQVLTITVTNVNEEPSAIELSSTTVAENEPIGTVVGDLSTTDPDADDTHTYELVAGEGDDDNASFTIDGNQLKTAEVFDQGTKDTYSVRIRSTDAEGLTTEQVLTITITEANVAPTAVELSNTTIDENVEAGTVVGVFNTTDANASDTHTYWLVAGEGDDDNAAFTIEGNELRINSDVDFETQDSYSIRVRSVDRYGLFVEEVITISVNDLNEAPTSIALDNDTVTENAEVGDTVGTLSTTDPDTSDTHTYELVAGEGDTDNAAFTIVGNELRLATELDFETQDTYSIRVRSTDQGGESVEQVLTITVSNVNEAPTAIEISSTSVAENEPIGTVVGLLSTTDPDAEDTHTYELVAGEGDDDNASFTIDGNQLKTAEVFDLLVKDTYSIRIRSTDAEGLTVEEVLTITITETNVGPTALMLDNTSVDENVEPGTTVGVFSTEDDNASDVHTYTLVAGEGDFDNAAFTIVGNELRINSDVDFETQESYSIRVRSTDPYGLFVEEVLTITVNDVNEAPGPIELSNNIVAESAPIGSLVGVLTALDPDSGDTVTFEFATGEGDDDNSLFSIQGNQLITETTFDADEKDTYTIRIRATDSEGLTVEQILIIQVAADI